MEGTTFNSVSVGFTKTEAYTKIPAHIRDKLTADDAAEVAVGNRIGEVEDVADVVGLLVSEKARVSSTCSRRKVFCADARSGLVEVQSMLPGARQRFCNTWEELKVKSSNQHSDSKV